MKKLTVTLVVLILLISGCAPPTTSPSPVPTAAPTTPQQPAIANPASVNCIEQGGTLTIETRGDDGQYGVCYFEDNRQCEEWALMYGDCPVGGFKVTGYVTPAARYCAITGGAYAITGKSGADDEQGTCTFKNGAVCDAWDTYNGKCDPDSAPAPAGATIQPLTMEVCDGQAQAMVHTLEMLAGTEAKSPLVATQSEAPLDDPITGANGTGCLATVTGTGVMFQSPEVVVDALGSMLHDQGWTEDPLLAAGGPTGIGAGYRKGKQISLASAIWRPDDSANCPKDQPVSACPVMPEQKNYTITLNSGEVIPVGQATTSPVETPAMGGGAGQIVFDSTRGGNEIRDLYVMNSDGSDMSRLTRGKANSFAGPWSPDGQRIVYTSYDGGVNETYLSVINADGSGKTIIDQINGSDEGFPDWSPDGMQIAFNSRRDGNNEIYLINADGSNAVRLTNQPSDDFMPSWSPDGTRIVFASDRDREAGFPDLYIMNADGSGVIRLTNDSALNYSPDWSPDGKQIVYRSDQQGQSEIFVINIDGSDRRNLTNNPANDWSPAWSPDGKYIAFQTNRDGNFEIYRIMADGADPVNLTRDPGDDQLPYWQPSTRSASTTAKPADQEITARMLVQPNALIGPGPSSFNWSPNGAILAYVDSLDGQDVLSIFDAATGDTQVILDPGDNPDQIDLSSMLWSPQGDMILLNSDSALWLLDPQTGYLKSLAEGGSKTSLAFSPDGARVAYVQDNDLYTIQVNDGRIVRLTSDGGETVFNGTLDWVYNEELATRSAQPAYAWSPDGKWLIHLRLDESEVQNHSVTNYQTVPPTLSYTRYPVAGSANPKAYLHMIELESGESTSIPMETDVEYIMPFFTWFPDSQEAVYVTENREHSVLELKAWNPVTGKGRTMVKETDPAWVNENSYAAPIFLDDGDQFLWLSEHDGFMHLYLYSRQGELIRQVTEGNWMIDTPAWNLLIPGRPVFVDPAGDWAYFSTTKNSPLERQIYRVKIVSGTLEQVSQPAGFHFGALSGDGQYLVDQFSDISTPPVTNILLADGTPVSVLGKCAGPTLDLPNVSREFLTIKAHDGVDLYAQIVKPENFDPNQKYPVIVHWYAGPTLQMVSNRYGKTNLFNHIERDVLYTQAGFIVWRLDNRGSFGRGHAFETPIEDELGKAALDDQLAGIEYLKTLPYIDASRIGADGKSFGGYMSLYALIHAPDVFKAGIVGSAPAKWEYYDTIYTERYMHTPSENPDGYAATDLISKADQLQNAPLIIHGLNDTNVHLQNSINLIQELERLDKSFIFLPLPNLNHSYKGDGLVAALSASVEYFNRMIGVPIH